MRRVTGFILAALALGLPAPGAVFGSGYAIYEQGAKAMASAGAFTARADDPSALFFNPAGILQLDGIRFNLGTNAIFLTGSEFTSTSAPTTGQRFDQIDTMAWPSSIYYTQKLNDSWAWGLGFTSPFGLKTEWGNTFPGRFISREANLAVVNFNPNLAFKLGKSWSVAVGADVARADIRELSKNIDLTLLGCPGCEGFTKLTGNANDVGWNVAARWANEKGWSWGASFRSKMKPEIDGHIKFENIPGPFVPLFPDGGAKASLPLPATFATGAGCVKGKSEGEFDVVWTDWSEFHRLRIDVKNNTPAVADVDQIEEWKDTYSFRLGYAYHVNDMHQYRVGAYYDRNPIPDDHVRPRLPDADRTSVQIGYGYSGKGGFTLDVAYQALFFKDRTATGSPGVPPGGGSDPVQPGEYKNFTNLLGVSLGWKFGK